MFTFDITKYVPQFILADKNGYAIAKAIEAAMQIVNDTVQTGADCVLNVDTMPEWRLDEVAWELNCLYDYNADIEVKRDWIKNAIPYYRIFGTPKSIKRYIGAYFEGVELDENWVYNGEPFHFRVIVEGEWTPYNEAWARKAIDKAKNVRSVLDSLDIGCRTFIGITAECEMLARFAYPLTGPENYAGRWPQENYIGILDETPHMGADATAEGRKFPYPLAGIRPEINTIGVLDETPRMGADATAEGHKFPYPLAGIRPEINMIGVLDESKAGIDGQIIGKQYGYPMTSENRTTGTHPQENYIGILDEPPHMGADATAEGHKFPYPLAGIRPEINTIGVLDETPRMGADATAEGRKFPYPLAGIRPEINTIGVLDESKAGIDGQIIGKQYGYPMTSENRTTGTHPQENYIGIAGENDIQAAEAEDLYTIVPYRMCGSDDI